MGGTIDPAQLDKILNKFRRSRTNEGTSDTATPVQVVDPLHPNARASMAEYLASNRAKYEMLDRMPLMEFELIEKSDWKDLDPGRRPAFNFRYLDDDNIVQLGSKVFDSLRGNVTSSTIPNLMLLAYNLKDHKGQRCFGKVPSELEKPERLTEFDPIHADNSQSYNESTAIGFCYLAASYMSLFTISAEKYMKIQTRIHTKFISFYGFSFPFASFHLPIESVKALKSLPGWNHLLDKYSFYNFIYAGEMTPVGKNLKDFLYVMHTAYTGMHPYKLFCQIMEALNVTNTYLATIMYSKETKRELDSLAGVFTNLKGNRHEDYKYQMWRFGRIIDPIFLSSLQTKNAKFFIAVCANILNMLSEESIKMSLFSLGGAEAPLLDIVAYAGYAFTGLCLAVLGRIIMSYSYYFLMPWTCLCMGIFLVKTMKRVLFSEVRSFDSSRHHYLLLFIALAQFPLFVWLGNITVNWLF